MREWWPSGSYDERREWTRRHPSAAGFYFGGAMTVFFTLMGLARGQFIWWLVAVEFGFCTAFMTWAVKTDWKPRFLPWPRNPDPLLGHREDVAAEPHEGEEDERRSRRGFFSAGFSGRKPSR